MKKTPRSDPPSHRKTKPTAASKPKERRGGKDAAPARPAGKRDGIKTSIKGASRAGDRGRPADRTAARGGRRSKGAGKNSPGVTTAQPAATPESSAASARALDQARALALVAIEAALDKKALMPVLIDVSGMASYTDFIGIVSGRSDRQVDAIADNVSQVMKARGRRVLGHEGGGNGRWTLLDFGEVVIHVFYHPVREFYDLESLWIDAPRVKMKIPPEAMLSQSDALYGAL